MNDGVISSRYALALCKFVKSSAGGERVFSQVLEILRDTSSAPPPLESELQKFVSLVVENHREDLLKNIFRSFVRIWCSENDIRIVELTTARPNPELERELCRRLEEITSCRIIIESKLDPDVLGGFSLEMDNCLYDATAKARIERLKNNLIRCTTI